MKKIVLLLLVFLFSLSLASAISVQNVELADLGFTGFVVEANLDTSGTAQVLYGKTGALGSSTSLTSTSTEHLLQINGLQENTVYFYRVVGKDSSGNSYSSAISLTRTPARGPDSSSFGISGFFLNRGADYYNKISDLQNGDTIDLASLPSNAFLTVSTTGATESVMFYVNGQYHNTENGAIWTFLNGLDDLPVGTHTILAKSYSVDGVFGSSVNNGVEGASKQISIKVIRSQAIPIPQPTPTPSPNPSSNPANTAKVTPPPTPTTSPVSLRSYGALGNGVTDDTVAIQNALNSEKYIVGEPGKTYLISKALTINKNMAQTIDFKGSTLTSKGHGSFLIYVNKRNYANTLTVIKNAKLDGRNKNVHGIDVWSRVHFENLDIYDMKIEGANGVRIMIYDDPGMYGRSVFDNVDIHNLRPAKNDGAEGTGPGYAHGFLALAYEKPSKPTQIVYINSDLYEFWGEDAGGITINSKKMDTSNSHLSYWFENIHVWDAQRRAVKSFTGGATWINSKFTSPDNNNPNLVPKSRGGANPAGLFGMGAGSSARGATNNLICGSTFEGHPSNPFDSWYTQLIISGSSVGHSVGVEIRNSEFSGGHGGRFSYNGITIMRELDDITIANTYFGTTNKIKTGGSTLKGTLLFDTNNVYEDGKATVLSQTHLPYVQRALPYKPCPTIS